MSNRILKSKKSSASKTSNASSTNPKTPSKKTASKTFSDMETVSQIKHKCKVLSGKLKAYTKDSHLPETTESAGNLDLTLGQDRAIHAMDTAFAIKATGYHVFAVGENGLGKRTFITQYLKQCGKQQGPLFDWIYTHNFEQPSQPLCIAITAGKAYQLQHDLQKIWQNLVQTFSHFKLQHPELIELLTLPNYIKALTNVSVASNSDKHNLSDISVNTNTIKKPSAAYIMQLQNEIQHLASQTLNPLFTSLLNNYQDNQSLINYLQQVMQDMIDNAFSILTTSDDRYSPNTLQSIPECYCINIIASQQSLVDNHLTLKKPYQQTVDKAPIVFVTSPTLFGLLGQITPSTVLNDANKNTANHLLIQGGALHKANGGYVIIDAHHLLEQPEAWHALKLILQSSRLDISKHLQSNQILASHLSPQAIPLNIKVILLGEPSLYEQFAENDPDFLTIFKIRADFHNEITRNCENELKMSAKMADIIRKYKLKHFDNTAQAEILDYLSLLCEDQNKLSLHTDSLIQLMLESERHADLTDNNIVSKRHVKDALADKRYRSGYLKQQYLQEITDGQQLINTSSTAVGQINALTIINYIDSEFGMPALLTAVVQHSVGSGDILDIERDVELGGSLHAKGMLIMNSYLRALFSPFHSLNFTASLAFEQSYAHIDGDSATLAEACALLSALANIPISQALGITGSMNQLGRVQAVGGINAKVVGFYDACLHQGLTGNQGVILPHANISQLMLRDDVIASVKAGKFHIYAVKTLSEALTILSGIPVDSVNKKGHYRKSSLFGKIIKNLQLWEEQLTPSEAD